jgi:hypothetical protein
MTADKYTAGGIRYGDCDTFPPGSVPVCAACRKPYINAQTPVYVGEKHYHKACVPTTSGKAMTHDEDVRLVDYLRKRLVQAADRDHVDYAIDARHADHEAIAAVIALVQEHEAFVPDHRCGIDALQGCDLCAAHDHAEEVLHR